MEKKDQKKSTLSKRYQHSTTIYIPRGETQADFIRAMRLRAEQLFGAAEKHGQVSKYIIGLIKQDFVRSKLFTKDGQPNKTLLDRLEVEFEKRKEAWVGLK